MQYTNLGRSGLVVSRVSLGSWLTIGNAIEQASSDALVRRAVEIGINLLDTADVYNMGEGETAAPQRGSAPLAVRLKAFKAFKDLPF